MRKVVMQEFVSLDGFVAGPNDTVDFIPASMQGDVSFGREQIALMERCDLLLLGRVTYEMFVGYWPNVAEGPENPFADKFNGLHRVVFSKTLDRAPWGKWNEGTVVRASAVEEVARLRQQPGKDIFISGSISIAQSLMAAGMVDECQLVLCPVVLGRGRPLFRDDAGSMSMHRLKATTLDGGAMSLVYSPRGAPS
jgi:dihydrofolate reductase